MSELSYLEKLLDGVEVEWKTLEDISIKISSGGTPKTGVSEFYDGDIPWLRTQEVNFCDIWDTEVKITESGVKNSREGANKRGNSSRLTQSFHFFMFEPIFSPVNAL
ncbi:hypothetical protein U4T62_22945, partial [Escherichia coli]|nr:hypothetical protein [Escherichia coli]